MAVNRHRSGPYVAFVQAYKMPRCGNQQAHTWQSTDTYMAMNRHIHGSQQAPTWQSTGTYMTVNMHIRSSHTHMAHMAVVRAYKIYRGAIKRSINW